MDLETGPSRRKEKKNAQRCGTLMIIILTCLAILLAFIALIISGGNISLWRQSNVTGNIQSQGKSNVEINDGAILIVNSGSLFENDGLAGYNPSLFDVYEETTFTAMFTGALTTNITVSINTTRVGNVVTMTWPQIIGACSSATNVFTSPGTIPTRFLPNGNMFFPVFVEDSSTVQTTSGALELLTTGILAIYKTAALGTFTASGSCGILTGSISFISSL